MNKLEFIRDYKEIEKYRHSFNTLAESIFGIDFENWYKKGLWTDLYQCYSYHDNGKIVANVSATKMDIIIEGVRHKAIQIGKVMTDLDYRNKGLSKGLMEIVLREYEETTDLFFLFANHSVLDFYPQFGFKAWEENRSFVEVASTNVMHSHVSRLHPSHSSGDLEFLIKQYSKRRLRSSKVDVEHAHCIQNFHLITTFSQDIYYLEDLQAIVIFRITEKVLHLFDVVSKGELAFQQLLQQIPSKGVEKVIFYFSPDFKDIIPFSTRINKTDDLCFLKSNKIKKIDCFTFPITAHA